MTAAPDNRQFAKLAVVIHSNLAQPSENLVGRDLPEMTWLQVRRELRRLRLAERRGWRQAQNAQRRELQYSLTRLHSEVQQLLTHLHPETPCASATPHNIYQDLLALHEEFSEVVWGKRGQTLSVTTESITLEGRYLGPFQIELNLQRLALHPSYTVVAQDPQPSSVNSDVCHPHVDGDQLCEGEGTMAIRASLREGRLLDFFLIVSNVLRTYNSSSAYVSLDAWDGARCSECDYAMDRDDARDCERCDTTLCSECVRYCCDCTESVCSNCSQASSGCDDDVCNGCTKQCCDCEQTFCPSCLSDDERCHSCHEEFQEQADREASDADVLPVQLGQAVVSAGSG